MGLNLLHVIVLHVIQITVKTDIELCDIPTQPRLSYFNDKYTWITMSLLSAVSLTGYSYFKILLNLIPHLDKWGTILDFL